MPHHHGLLILREQGNEPRKRADRVDVGGEVVDRPDPFEVAGPGQAHAHSRLTHVISSRSPQLSSGRGFVPYRAIRVQEAAMLKKLWISLALLLIVPASASAASWTPAKVAQTLTTMIPLAQSSMGWIDHGFIKNPTCTSKAGGRFVCRATVQASITMSQPVSLYVRPWTPTKLCVSRISPAVCAANLIPHDPRVCDRRIADGCLLQAAVAAFVRARGGGVSPPRCAPAGALRFTCDDGATVRTVSWSRQLRVSVG